MPDHQKNIRIASSSEDPSLNKEQHPTRLNSWSTYLRLQHD